MSSGLLRVLSEHGVTTHAAAKGAIRMRSPPRATCVMHEVLEAGEGEGGGGVWKAGNG